MARRHKHKFTEPDEVVITRPDGKREETLFISAAEILTAPDPVRALLNRIVGQANSVGLLGRVIIEWEAVDDISARGGKKVRFLTQDYDTWYAEQEENQA